MHARLRKGFRLFCFDVYLKLIERGRHKPRTESATESVCSLTATLVVCVCPLVGVVYAVRATSTSRSVPESPTSQHDAAEITSSQRFFCAYVTLKRTPRTVLFYIVLPRTQRLLWTVTESFSSESGERASDFVPLQLHISAGNTASAQRLGD